MYVLTVGALLFCFVGAEIIAVRIMSEEGVVWELWDEGAWEAQRVYISHVGAHCDAAVFHMRTRAGISAPLLSRTLRGHEPCLHPASNTQQIVFVAMALQTHSVPICATSRRRSGKDDIAPETHLTSSGQVAHQSLQICAREYIRLEGPASRTWISLSRPLCCIFRLCRRLGYCLPLCRLSDCGLGTLSSAHLLAAATSTGILIER